MSKRHGIWMLGVALLVCASTAAALSLGRARGAVLVGRGLDLSVQTTLDAQEPLPEVNCIVADVFYGDVRVSPNAVSVTTERSAVGEARIRIRTNAAVDEPVVTLYLRSTCGASVSRRYVLLADTLTEPETGLPAVIAPVQIPRVTAPPAEPAPPPPAYERRSCNECGRRCNCQQQRSHRARSATPSEAAGARSPCPRAS